MTADEHIAYRDRWVKVDGHPGGDYDTIGIPIKLSDSNVEKFCQLHRLVSTQTKY